MVITVIMEDGVAMSGKQQLVKTILFMLQTPSASYVLSISVKLMTPEILYPAPI